MRTPLQNLAACILCLGFSALVETPVAAQEALIMGLNGDLHSVDLDSGKTNYIGDTGHHTHFWHGLAMDSQGRLFGASGDWITGYRIYEINPSTGAGSLVYRSTLFGVHCIEFGPNDELFVIDDPKGPSYGGIHDLYSIDLQAGTESYIGSTGILGIYALTFDGTEMYGFDNQEGLVKVDMTTGAATDQNPNFRGPFSASIAMCFDREGALYFIDHVMWMMDKESGIYNPVNWLDVFGYWGEAVIVDGSTPHFSLWLTGTAGHYMMAKMTGATPNGQVMLMWAKGEGGPTPIPNRLPCSGVMMDLSFPIGKVAIAETDAKGAAMIGPGLRRVPAAAAGLIWFQAIDLTNCNKSNRIQLRY